ncbi:SH3 domain-containing YSC84-like protein 1 [Phytophthora boehmeriae]|uniref:SH3 domain-containing YSC84-like protein 1 n=1 Tax=Phytophthora boehmeriae TaxID=109152 RepID=A0A8T1X0U0_9STRA|nr:SH3 domain-containing YSC84-like protein 1 [Phytophthora boehmeriae]
MRFCFQCGYRFPGESAASVLSSRAVGSAASAVPNRRNVPKSKQKKKKPKDKSEKPKDKSEKPKDLQVPPAAAGDEAAAIYKRMLAAVRGANKDHDEVVAAFKADCKLYGQGELRARVFYDRLAGYFGSELMLEHMIPQLARLIPDDKKRKKLVKAHVKNKSSSATVTRQSHRPVSLSSSGLIAETSSRLPPSVRPSGDRRPYSASELIRRDSIESDTSSNTSGEIVPTSASSSRLAMTRSAEILKCAICNEVFDIKRRKHRCRKCGASVCHSCSPARMLISPDQVASESMKKKYDPAHPQRVCTICAPILQCFQDGLNSQYANCHKENPHEAKTRLHLPYSRSLESACRSAADILGNFFRPDFGADSDRYIPVSFLKRAHGIAFLTVIKAGLLITAKMGTGIVIAKLDDGAWSAPSAIGTAGIGGGFEAGGELIEVMIVMGSKNAVKVFHRTQVNVGGGLSVAVGPYGRDALAQAAASRGGFNANYSYSHSRGLFAGISLHGAVITARTEMNSNFYGQKLTPEEILSGTVAQPRAAQCLYEAIDRAMDGIAQYDTSGSGKQKRSTSAAAVAADEPCTSCRCEQFVPKAFSKKCKTCAHVHNPVT